MGQIPKGLLYVKSVPFFLKIGSFVVLLIAIITLGLFLDKADVKLGLVTTTFDLFGKKGGLDYGMFAVVISWLVVILMVVLFVTGLHEKISVINWPLTVAINMVIWALLLFVAGCIIADTARVYDKKKKPLKVSFCDGLKNSDNDARCGHLVAAAVMCFVATVIFVADAFFNFQLFRGKETPSATPAAVQS